MSQVLFISFWTLPSSSQHLSAFKKSLISAEHAIPKKKEARDMGQQVSFVVLIFLYYVLACIHLKKTKRQKTCKNRTGSMGLVKKIYT